MINKIKEYKVIIVWLMLLPFIPIFLKFDWLLLFPFLFRKNKQKFRSLMLLSVFLLPDIRVIYYMNQFNGITPYFYINTAIIPFRSTKKFYREYLGNEYDFNKYDDKELNLLKFKCDYKNNNCFFINKNSPVSGQFAGHISLQRYRGKFNLYDDNKREKYKINKYLTDKRIFNKVIFIPLSKEDLIIYNYGLLKNYALKELNNNENECKLLMYGSQNGWKEYTQKLINKLEQDKNNECIDNISGFAEEDTKQIEYNKKEILRFLKELKQ